MLNIELDFEVANTEICQELTLMKLELLKDYDINYRPGYRVVLEHNLQSARDFGLKEYKTRKREVEFYDNVDKAIEYLKEKAIDYQLKADEEKAKLTDEYDAPIREYWCYTAAYRAMQVLMRQITEGDTYVIRNW